PRLLGPLGRRLVRGDRRARLLRQGVDVVLPALPDPRAVRRLPPRKHGLLGRGRLDRVPARDALLLLRDRRAALRRARGAGGDALYFAVAQRETWGRALTNPIHTMHKAWTTAVFGSRYAFHPHTIFGNDGVEPAFKASDTFNLILFGLLVLLLVLGILKLPPD